MGDFAQRRMPELFREPWDRWLQNGLAKLRARHTDWTERYLKAPLWCFVLSEGVIDGRSWLGVLMPSVDGVGRYFPFTLTAELVSSRDRAAGRGAGAHAALVDPGRPGRARGAGARPRCVALRCAAPGAVRRRRGARPDTGEHPPLALPEVGHSLWFTDPGAERGLGMTSHGLPQDEQFEALFGFGNEPGVRQEAGP